MNEETINIKKVDNLAKADSSKGYLQLVVRTASDNLKERKNL